MQQYCLISTECTNKPADIIFVLDASSSIWTPNFRKQIAFARNLSEEFDISNTQTRCGLVTFSDQVREEFSLSSYPVKSELIESGFKSIRQLLGNTRTDLALHRMREMFQLQARPGVAKVAIVLTDGESDKPVSTAEQATLAHKEGIKIFAIGIGSATDSQELRALASREDYVYELDNFDALGSIRGFLVEKTCQVDADEENSLGKLEKLTMLT